MNSNKYLEQSHLKHYREAILNIIQEIPHIFILEFQIKHGLLYKVIKNEHF